MKIVGRSSLGRRRICRGDFGDAEREIKRRKTEPSPIQRLFLACKSIFDGFNSIPSSSDVCMIRTLLDRMTPDDVDLSPDIPFFKATTAVKGAPGITYTTIYQSKKFSICIFFLRPGAVIPLHDHPGMTVFSKLLLGSMHVRAYDFVYTPHLTSGVLPQEGRRRKLAKLKVDAELTAPCKTSVLFPEKGGNIHAFTAITPCAVLDIMGPPYSAQDGRDITYYKDFPFSDGELEGERDEAEYWWLEETDVPEEAALAPVTYLGPPIVDV